MASFVLCGKCGARVPISSKFCPECGGSVIQQATQPSRAQAAPPPAAPVHPSQASAGVGQPYRPVQYQQPMQYQPQPRPISPRPRPVRKKKNNGCLIAFIVVLLILAALGIGGWAVYKYVIKPKIEKVEKKISSFDSDDGDSFSTDATSNDDNVNNDVEENEKTQEVEEKSVDDIPQGLSDNTKLRDTKANNKKSNRKKVKPKNDVPFGMTDEEAAAMRNYNGGEPFGMTDEEAAAMRRYNKRRR